jgi:VacB/RNase II family 3'-5' exoribonuclease
MNHSSGLQVAARRAMAINGFEAEFPPEVLAEATAAAPPTLPASDVQDLRGLPWSSIDNDSSRDLDQLEVAELLANDEIRVSVAIADVSATVVRDSATDRHAALNATSVYTGITTFPMLPERLSTDLTSLGQGADRAAVVIEFIVKADGAIGARNVYLAFVHNRAKLAYGTVGAFLTSAGALPPVADAIIQAQLHVQDTAADRLRAERTRRGALSFETIEAQGVVREDGSVNIELVQKTEASHLIEDFMVAANIVMAEFLDEKRVASIRRVVRTPERWNRIVALAIAAGDSLPDAPDAPALAGFLARRQKVDPTGYADLSLSIVKLLGPGQYEVHQPGAPETGHFGLATQYYTHSTAPNRRFVDLVTQRILKAALRGDAPPYSDEQLAQIAAHSTERENAARKVERLVRKETAATSMVPHIGETFDAVVTGVTPQGTYVRVVKPPVEGRVMHGEAGMDVGDKVRVKLLSTDPARGFIDFAGVAGASSGHA